METKKYKLGELIAQRREKNPGDESLPILGVSKNGFISPKQLEADTSIYNVFYKYDFVYNPARMELGSIAFNNSVEKGICSSLYEVFYVIRKDVLLPEFLELFVSQSEFSRYCNFLSSGSAREYCRFINISQIHINVPPIEEQLKIVKDYKTVKKRINILKELNITLEKQVLCIYESWFEKYEPFGGIMPLNWKEVFISDIAQDIVCGKTPSTDDDSNFGGDIPFITIPDMHNSVYAINTERTLSTSGVSKLIPVNSVSVSCIATVGLVNLVAKPSQTNQQINSIICKKNISPYFIYLKMTTLKSELEALGGGGSATLNVSKSLFSKIKIILPDDETMNNFDVLVKPSFELIRKYQIELESLLTMQDAILTLVYKK